MPPYGTVHDGQKPAVISLRRRICSASGNAAEEIRSARTADAMRKSDGPIKKVPRARQNGSTSSQPSRGRAPRSNCGKAPPRGHAEHAIATSSVVKGETLPTRHDLEGCAHISSFAFLSGACPSCRDLPFGHIKRATAMHEHPTQARRRITIVAQSG